MVLDDEAVTVSDFARRSCSRKMHGDLQGILFLDFWALLFNYLPFFLPSRPGLRTPRES